ncbi:MAG: hypothetical protein ACREON_03700, partial [Gemmatimonadaceae bacterium]
MEVQSSRVRAVWRALALFGVVTTTTVTTSAPLAANPIGSAVPVVAVATLPVLDAVAAAEESSLDSLLGRSGKLRARFLPASSDLYIPHIARLFGDSALGRPGVHTVADSELGSEFSLITLRPFADKVRGRIGTYRIGFWPYERRATSPEAYRNPDGFIEVTRDNQETHVSEHFRLRDFLTKDQHAVWPKYLVLDERLLDKLELVIDELNDAGIPVTHLSVMSGFRTPQYNARGVGEGGRASASRHQYGDAADVFVDNDRDGWMDDLNRDGRVDRRDAGVLLQAAERVEVAHPELVGGVGVY